MQTTCASMEPEINEHERHPLLLNTSFSHPAYDFGYTYARNMNEVKKLNDVIRMFSYVKLCFRFQPYPTITITFCHIIFVANGLKPTVNFSTLVDLAVVEIIDHQQHVRPATLLIFNSICTVLLYSICFWSWSLHNF